MSLACPAFLATHVPALCRAVDHYCERTGAAFDAEPVNALTNTAFLIAAGAAWRLQTRHGGSRLAWSIRALTVLVAVVGLGSFLFHTIATRWAEWADVVPIFVFVLAYSWLALTHLLRVSLAARIAVLLFLFCGTLYLEAAVPGSVLWGGALYLPTLAVLVCVGAVLYRWRHPARRAMVFAIGTFLLAFAMRSLDMPACARFPLGTHFIWHVLNATFLYLLLRVLILYGGPVPGRRK